MHKQAKNQLLINWVMKLYETTLDMHFSSWFRIRCQICIILVRFFRQKGEKKSFALPTCASRMEYRFGLKSGILGFLTCSFRICLKKFDLKQSRHTWTAWTLQKKLCEKFYFGKIVVNVRSSIWQIFFILNNKKRILKIMHGFEWLWMALNGFEWKIFCNVQNDAKWNKYRSVSPI